MLRTKAGHAFSFNVQTAMLFAPEHYDPKTTKPLVEITGLVDHAGNPLPPALVTCNTLISMGEGAKAALAVWAAQGPKTEGSA